MRIRAVLGSGGEKDVLLLEGVAGVVASRSSRACSCCSCGGCGRRGCDSIVAGGGACSRGSCGCSGCCCSGCCCSSCTSSGGFRGRSPRLGRSPRRRSPWRLRRRSGGAGGCSGGGAGGDSCSRWSRRRTTVCGCARSGCICCGCVYGFFIIIKVRIRGAQCGRVLSFWGWGARRRSGAGGARGLSKEISEHRVWVGGRM